jgi:hypothetical protein
MYTAEDGKGPKSVKTWEYKYKEIIIVIYVNIYTYIYRHIYIHIFIYVPQQKTEKGVNP